MTALEDGIIGYNGIWDGLIAAAKVGLEAVPGGGPIVKGLLTYGGAALIDGQLGVLGGAASESGNLANGVAVAFAGTVGGMIGEAAIGAFLGAAASPFVVGVAAAAASVALAEGAKYYIEHNDINLADVISSDVTAVGNAISDLFQKASDAVTETLTEIGHEFSNAAEFTDAFFDKLGQKVDAGLASALDGAATAISANLTAFQQFADGLLDLLGGSGNSGSGPLGSGEGSGNRDDSRDGGGGGFGGGGPGGGSGPFGGARHDPLVIDLTGTGSLIGASLFSPYYDWSGTNFANRTGWVGAGAGFLARDLNSDGQITADEMFGSSGMDGFTALGALDTNDDGVIDALDSDFSSLVVWQDTNADGSVEAGELQSLTELDIISISLATTNSGEVANGNTIVETATVIHGDGRHTDIAEVEFGYSPIYTKYTGSVTVSAAANALPQIDGYGQLLNLQSAMTQDAVLLGLVQDLLAIAPADKPSFDGAIEGIMYRWAGVEGISPTDRGGYFDAQKLSFLESFFGQAFNSHGEADPFFEGQIALLDNSWEKVFQSIKARFLVQDNSSPFFSLFSIDTASDTIFPLSDFPSIVAAISAQAPTEAGPTVDYWVDALTIINASMADLGALAEAFAQPVSDALTTAAPAGFTANVLFAAAHGTLTYIDASSVNESMSGSSTVYGTVGTDLFDVTAPNMKIIGRGGSDEYLVGEGIGHLEIGNVIDTFVHSAGENHAAGGNGVLYLKAGIDPADVVVTATGDESLILTLNGSGDQIKIDNALIDGVYGFSSIQKIVFSDGTIWIPTELVPANSTGTSGDDVLFGTSSANTLDGHGGHDTAAGMGGGDTFIFNAGYGQLLIGDSRTGDIDNTLQFGAGITPDDITVTSDSVDLILTIGSSGDQVTLDSMLANAGAGVQRITFADGTIWTREDLLAREVGGSSSDDTIFGTGGADILDGHGGNDVITGNGGNDAFLFNLGYGHLQLKESDFSPTADNTLLFGAGIQPGGITVKGVETNIGRDIVLTVDATGDQVTLENMLLASNYGVQSVGFSDGTVWTRQQLVDMTTTGTSGDDSLYGTPGADTFDGKGGNDYAEGFGGSDTYIFNAGYGTLTIEDSDPFNAPSQQNVLKLGAGIDPSHVRVYGKSGPITITDDFGDRIVLKDGISSFNHPETAFWTDYPTDVQQIEFADGTIWTGAEILAQISGQYFMGTAGGDNLLASYGSDTIDGLGGVDTITGRGGGDTFIYKSGYGHLTINETDVLTAPSNVLQFGSGIAASDIHVTFSGADLKLSIDSDNDVTLKQFLNGQSYGVQEVEFADGTTWDRAELLSLPTTGTSGNDSLYGRAGADTFDGKGGIDNEYGFGGNDTFIFNAGYGQLTVHEQDGGNNPLNTLVFGQGISALDVTVTSVGADITLTIGSNGDEVTLSGMAYDAGSGVQQVSFADGTVWSRQDVLDRLLPAGEEITGTTGDDVLGGTDGGDIIDGLGGNDLVFGRGGGDVFIFNAGYGHLEINEFDSNPSANNVLRLGTGIVSSDVSLSADAQGDVILTIGSSGDQVQLDYQDYQNGLGVQSVEFADGTVWTGQQLYASYLTSTTGDDALFGTAGADTVDGQGGNDYVRGQGGDDVFHFDVGYGSLTILERDTNPDAANVLQFGAGIAPEDVTVSANYSGDVILTIGTNGDTVLLQTMRKDAHGGVQQVTFADETTWSRQDILDRLMAATTGDDKLYGTLGSDSFDGLGGNDYEEGEGGNDTFIFNSGYGHLEINAYGETGTPNNILQLGSGIAVADVTATGDGLGNVVLTIGSSGDRITIDGMQNDPSAGVQSIHFADGTIWTSQDVLDALPSNSIMGTAGDDTLSGTAGSDTFDGLGGNDQAYGQGGNDAFIFNVGYGHLEISEQDSGGTPGNILQLGAGIGTSDVQVSSDISGNVILTIGSSGDQVTLDGMQGNPSSGVQSVHFDDGTVWSRQDVLDQIVPYMVTGTTDDDTLFGTIGVDVFDGLGGNDYEEGEGGNDTFVFNSGYGQLRISEVDTAQNPTNVLQLGAGISTGDVQVSTDGYAVILTIGTDGDQVTFDGMLNDATSGVQHVTFSDRTSWSREDVLALIPPATVTGTTDDDFLIGTSSAELIDGLGGNDYEEGQGGNDTFVFNTGYGHLEINEVDPAVSPNNLLKLGSGIAPSDVRVTAVKRTTYEDELPKTHLDLVLTIGTSGDRVTLDDMISDPARGIQGVSFADGTVWSRADLMALERAGTTGNDMLFGTADAETFDGLGGTDLEQGGGGGDTFIFNAGYGHLEISESDTSSSSVNALQFGAGIGPADVVVSTNGYNIVLTIGSGGDRVTLDQMLGLNPITNGVQQISFADGTTWSRADLIDKATIGTSGNNTLFGTTDANTFDGKGGTDTVYGEGGNDTFIFDAGYGTLQINQSDPGGTAQSVLQFGAGIAPSDVQISKNVFGDVVFSVGASGDTVKVTDMLDSQANGIQAVTFSDGTTWSRRDILNALVTGTVSSFEHLTGTAEAETFDGMGGTDDYIGQGGDDLYRVNTNAEFLTIDNHGPDSAAHGTLQFSSGISKDDLWFSRDAGDLKITVVGASTEVTLENWFMGDPSAQLSEIKLSDGTALDSQLNQLVAAMASYAHNTGFDPDAATQMPTDTNLQNTIAASWHA